MIIDKSILKSVTSEPAINVTPNNNSIVAKSSTLEEVHQNPFVEVYNAVRKTLEKLTVDPNNPNSDPLFQTIKIDNGQFMRIMRDRYNSEFAVGFPAVFIRFVNVRYLVAQQRIGEGRATMRIRFILNDLNNSDDVMEVRGFEIFQRINVALQDAKSKERALSERFNLTYFDMPESQNYGLQSFWIDYEVWFSDFSAYVYKDWIDRYLTMPPFTNEKDAPEHHEDEKKWIEVDIDDAVSIYPSGFQV